MTYINYLAVIAFLCALINTTSAVTCKTPDATDNQKTTFCFFSLNNAKEDDTLKRKYKDNPNVEVKEFYQESGKSVEESFKKMMESERCDNLVISGHHTGYFAGKQSISKGNTSQTLDLDFMEEMACEEGCEDWFSNVDSLFLMGCQTVKTDEQLRNSKTADSETIRVITKEAKETDGVKAIYRQQHTMMNQAYSSTLSENNKLSHHYLKMFPNSSLYGWGGVAPGEDSGSQHSLPNFIDLVEKINSSGSSDSSDDSADNILNFIDFMNSQNQTCKKYTADRWTRHWEQDSTIKPTACYLDLEGTNKEKLKAYHRKGCRLAKAVKDNNQTDINRILDDILTRDSDDTDGAEIKANFNRLMSLITNQENKDKPWYSQVISKLKQSETLKDTLISELKSNKVGFTRKADYLYFYNEMQWTKDRENISETYLKQLQTAFDAINKEKTDEKIKTAHHHSLFNSIAQNKLGKWLYDNNEEEFKNLKSKFLSSTDPELKISGHLLSLLGDDKPNTETAEQEIKKYMEQESWFKDYMCKHESYVAEEIELFNCSP